MADRLVIHLKSCKGGGVGSKPSAARSGSGSPPRGGLAPPEEKKGGAGASPNSKGSPAGSSPAMIKKPKTLMCYICGREFGTSSLEIHIKSCIKKWELEESKKPKGERRPVPSAPQNFDDMVTGKVSSENMESYNQEANKSYNEKALMPCPNCGRTFLPDRLDVHLKSCNKAQGKAADAGSPTRGSPAKMGGPGAAKASPGGSKPSPGGSSGMIVRPKTIVCYICGREYGTSSIEIHLKTCRQKWDIEQSKLPVKERKPCPEPPKQF